jgi:hypothetical protein
MIADTAATLGAVVILLLSLAWLVFVIWWMVTVTGTLKRIAGVAEWFRDHQEVEDEFADSEAQE